MNKYRNQADLAETLLKSFEEQRDNAVREANRFRSELQNFRQHPQADDDFEIIHTHWTAQMAEYFRKLSLNTGSIKMTIEDFKIQIVSSKPGYTVAALF